MAGEIKQRNKAYEVCVQNGAMRVASCTVCDQPWERLCSQSQIPSLQAKCQHVIFQSVLNLLFPKLASTIPTIATPLNVKPPTPLYFYPPLCQITPRRTKNDIAIGEDYSTIKLGIPMGYTAE